MAPPPLEITRIRKGQWVGETSGVCMSDYSLEDYDPSRSPVSYDVMYLPFVYMVRCLAGMSPYGLIPSFSPCSFSTFREWAAIFFGVQAVCGGDELWSQICLLGLLVPIDVGAYRNTIPQSRRVFTSLVRKRYINHGDDRPTGSSLSRSRPSGFCLPATCHHTLGNHWGGRCDKEVSRFL